MSEFAKLADELKTRWTEQLKRNAELDKIVSIQSKELAKYQKENRKFIEGLMNFNDWLLQVKEDADTMFGNNSKEFHATVKIQSKLAENFNYAFLKYQVQDNPIEEGKKK